MGQIVGYDSLLIGSVLSWILALVTFFLKFLIKKRKNADLLEKLEEIKSVFSKLKQIMFILFYVYVGCTILGNLISWYLGKVPVISWQVDLMVILGIFLPGLIFFKTCEEIGDLMRGKAKIPGEGGDNLIRL